MLEQVFAGKQLQESRLSAYGFRQLAGEWHYCERIMDDAFEVRVAIRQGELSAVIWDMDLDEEYRAIAVKTPLGSFVHQVREAYLEVLEKIARSCYESSAFLSDQGRRIAALLAEKFPDSPDYPFTKAPDIAVYRHPDNQKWYVLIVQVSASVFEGLSGQEMVEVINIKVAPSEMEQVLALPSVYPAYHMSKKTWVSLVLNDGLKDQVIVDLIEKSRSLVAPKTKRQKGESQYWILPANPKQYDIDSELRQTKGIVWQRKARIQEGDIVCIYMTAPIQAVRYICRVVALQSEKAEMELELVTELEDSILPFARLKELGIKAVRGPRVVTSGCLLLLKELMATP